jgi:hypothetical protein
LSTPNNHLQLKKAVEAALTGDWDKSHKIAQDYSDPIANWIHAVLHKIEGDEWNSRYWYARSAGKSYEDFADPNEELRRILTELN